MNRKNSIPLYQHLSQIPETLLIALCAVSLLAGSDRAYLVTVVCFCFTVLRSLDRLIIPLTRYWDNKNEREHELQMAQLRIAEYVIQNQEVMYLPVPAKELLDDETVCTH